MNNLDEFLKDIEDLKEAKRLLEKLYSEIGPYRDYGPAKTTWSEVKNYFKFDDSE